MEQVPTTASSALRPWVCSRGSNWSKASLWVRYGRFSGLRVRVGKRRVPATYEKGFMGAEVEVSVTNASRRPIVVRDVRLMLSGAYGYLPLPPTEEGHRVRGPLGGHVCQMLDECRAYWHEPHLRVPHRCERPLAVTGHFPGMGWSRARVAPAARPRRCRRGSRCSGSTTCSTVPARLALPTSPSSG